MAETIKKHVHFMGICGSGCASIAMIASDAGYTVSGCDQSADSYYAGELKKKGIPIYVGHDKAHLTDDVDIVAVSPAIFDINPDNEELLLAKEKGILMTWQEFMGRYLQADKRVIAISGTHGKTTTTFLTAEVLIDAGLDPTVEGGSVYKKWKIGGRSGSSDLFMCEADEFNRNFHHYKPEIAVLNNVEMDHPECYDSFEELTESFAAFLKNSPKLKTVILNGESFGAVEVLKQVRSCENVRKAHIIAFAHAYLPGLQIDGLEIEQVFYHTDKKSVSGTDFTVIRGAQEHHFKSAMFGEYNVSNALSAILIAWTLGVSDESISGSLARFSGVGRRFDPVGTCMNVPVYDDYAHHPTEIRSVLTMCKEYFPEKKLIAVFEPHQVSRLRLMFDDYVSALKIADRTVIAKTHLGREIHKNVTPITEREWLAASDTFLHLEDPEAIRDEIVKKISDSDCDMVIVIGAANSYKISRMLCETDN